MGKTKPVDCCNQCVHRAGCNQASKVILQFVWFCVARLCDWLKNLAPFSQPIRSKTKTNRDLLACVLPRLAPATCICFKSNNFGFGFTTIN